MADTNKIVDTLIKGKSIGVIIALILFMGYLVYSHQQIQSETNTLIGNHIDHTNEALNNVASSNVIIAESLSELSTIIKLK